MNLFIKNIQQSHPANTQFKHISQQSHSSKCEHDDVQRQQEKHAKQPIYSQQSIQSLKIYRSHEVS